MAKNVLKATDEVLNVIRSSNIDDEGITLVGQLDRPLYTAVNKFLETAGAKWNRKAKRHIFDQDAKSRIEALISTGEILNEKNAFQTFFTPTEVAKELATLADVQPNHICLEPSAGHGAIAEALVALGGKVTCVELNPRNIPVLKEKGLHTIEADFLTVAPFEVDRVCMNPPFNNDQDIRHVLHAFSFLKKGGKLIAVMLPGFTFGGTRIRKDFREFVAKNGRIVRELPEGTFKESGTNVRTVVVMLTK